MRVFCYFIEPASYTLDLANHVHDNINIDYCFIKSNTLVYTDVEVNKVFLDNKSFFQKIRFIFSIFSKYDLIIVNGYNNLPFIVTFFFIFFMRKKKYLAIESDTQYSYVKNPFKRLIKWIYLSFIFRTTFVLGFAGGNYSHKDLFRFYGMSETRIFLIPLVVNNNKFYNINKNSPSKFTFLYVGRLVKHKNVDALIQTFNSTFSNDDVVLKIVGSGDQSLLLRSRYESKKVCFLGSKFDQQLINEFHSSSCFLCPSLFEPWGLVVNEALSSGLPVIVTKYVGSSKDLIFNQKTGYIVNDMQEFGDKMIYLYKNRDVLSEYSNNAINLMKLKWNYDLYKRQLLQVINNINQKNI